MFFSLFSRLAASEDVFIPFNITQFPYVPTVKEKKMWSYINNTDFVAVLVAPSDKEEIVDMHRAFASASAIYAHGGPFLYLDSKDEIKLTQKYLVKPPALFLFKNHSLWLASTFPMSEVSLLFTLKHFFSQTLETADSLRSIYNSLGHFRFTMISTPDLVQETLDLRFKVAPYLGPMDIIVTTRKNLNKLNISMDQIALFRQEDHAIQSVALDFDAFFNATMPVFRNFVLSDFNNAEKVFAGLMTDVLTIEMEEFLFEQAELHPDIIVGWIPRQLRYVAERSTLQGYPKDNFVAFNPVFRYYYPNDKYVSYTLNYDFNKNDYNKSFGPYLDDISSGKLKLQFHSENLTKKDTEGPVQKLNAESYKHFLRNQVDDLVVLYLKSSKDNNTFFIDEFKAAAKQIRELGLENVSFAYINTYNNSGDFFYPYILDYPHIRFFPRQNHSWSTFFLHVYRADDIESFVVRCMTPRPNVTIPQKSHEEFKREAGLYIRIMGQLESSERNRMTDYFKNTWQELQIPIDLIKEDVEEDTLYGDDIKNFDPTKGKIKSEKKEKKETEKKKEVPKAAEELEEIDEDYFAQDL